MHFVRSLRLCRSDSDSEGYWESKRCLVTGTRQECLAKECLGWSDSDSGCYCLQNCRVFIASSRMMTHTHLKDKQFHFEKMIKVFTGNFLKTSIQYFKYQYFTPTVALRRLAISVRSNSSPWALRWSPSSIGVLERFSRTVPGSSREGSTGSKCRSSR